MLKRITIVLAPWCPHCVPLSLEKAEQMAKELDVELRVLDIDHPEQESIADKLVKEHGDYSEDYLIPQVFFEEDGKVEHVFTGFSEGVDVTRARWDDFFASAYYQHMLKKKTS
jgi:thiol-disulfide isomerase/thioredoxin